MQEGNKKTNKSFCTHSVSKTTCCFQFLFTIYYTCNFNIICQHGGLYLMIQVCLKDATFGDDTITET